MVAVTSRHAVRPGGESLADFQKYQAIPVFLGRDVVWYWLNIAGLSKEGRDFTAVGQINSITIRFEWIRKASWCEIDEKRRFRSVSQPQPSSPDGDTHARVKSGHESVPGLAGQQFVATRSGRKNQAAGLVCTVLNSPGTQ